jgi:hypothetical protein
VLPNWQLTVDQISFKLGFLGKELVCQTTISEISVIDYFKEVTQPAVSYVADSINKSCYDSGVFE